MGFWLRAFCCVELQAQVQALNACLACREFANAGA
jgi:hypothetical protein